MVFEKCLYGCVCVRMCTPGFQILSFYLADFNRTGLISFVWLLVKNPFFDSPKRFCFILNFDFSKIYFCFFNDRIKTFESER